MGWARTRTGALPIVVSRITSRPRRSPPSSSHPGWNASTSPARHRDAGADRHLRPSCWLTTKPIVPEVAPPNTTPGCDRIAGHREQPVAGTRQLGTERGVGHLDRPRLELRLAGCREAGRSRRVDRHPEHDQDDERAARARAMSRRRVRRRTGASGVVEARCGARSSSRRSCRGPVAHAADGLDRAARHRPQLAAREVDVGVDDRGRDLGVVRPGVVEELVAAEHPAAVPERGTRAGELRGLRSTRSPSTVTMRVASSSWIGPARASSARRRRGPGCPAPHPRGAAPRSRTA